MLHKGIPRSKLLSEAPVLSRPHEWTAFCCYPCKNQLIFKDEDLKLKTCLVHFNIPDRCKSKFKNIILKYMRGKLMPVLQRNAGVIM